MVLTRANGTYTYRTPTAEVTLDAATFTVTGAAFRAAPGGPTPAAPGDPASRSPGAPAPRSPGGPSPRSPGGPSPRSAADPVSLRPAAELAVLLDGLADHPLVGEEDR